MTTRALVRSTPPEVFSTLLRSVRASIHPCASPSANRMTSTMTVVSLPFWM